MRRKALVVEDNALMRSLIVEALEQRNFDVVEVDRASAALRAFRRDDPDVVVIDVWLDDGMDGLELGTVMRALAPYVGLVFLTAASKPLPDMAPVPTGAAYVDKARANDISVVMEAIESALDDERVPIRHDLAAEPSALESLTPLQMRVLALLASGLTNRQIAIELTSTTRSVERVVARIFDNLHVAQDDKVNPRVAAARIYLQQIVPTHPGKGRGASG